ncbi:MAG: hypothetical protein IKP71_03365 [Candidatus Riflebacteria bacterium]|nr:hypothetical protein [Candidatus Riflebacteria bacterium]
MKFYGNRKNGSALVIALVFSFCMMIAVGAMVFRQTSTSSHNKLTLLNKQAFFAARSAMQHFLLKAKLFPTELYDAVEISQGKNPLFNFTEFSGEYTDGREAFEESLDRANIYIKKVYSPEVNTELTSEGKPRYYYIKLPSKNTFIRLASFHNPDYRFLTKDLAKDSQNVKYTEPNEPNSEYNATKYLAYYYRDCTNYPINDKNLQPNLEIIKANGIKNPNKFDIAVEDGYPYTMRYSVADVKVKAIQGMRKYGEEAIEITVEGSATDFQNKNQNQLIVHTQRITRKGSI